MRVAKKQHHRFAFKFRQAARLSIVIGQTQFMAKIRTRDVGGDQLFASARWLTSGQHSKKKN